MAASAIRHTIAPIIFVFFLFCPHDVLLQNAGVLQFEDILPEDPSSYDKMRPPKKAGKPTTVYFHVTVMSIDSINENSMTFATDIFFAQSWKDHRLRLPENMTSDYRLLEVDWLGQMWRPDSFFKNAKQVTFQTMTIPNHYVWLYQSKSILYMVKLTLTLSCAMNYAIYPHDTQECKLQMESLSHTTEDLIFEWDPDVPLVVDKNIELPQFDIVNNRTADCSQVYSTGNFTCLEVIFILKRRLGYYLFHTYMPTCLIVIMSWVSFWIKPEAAPARVTLGVTSLLTLSTQHAKSQASLPPVSYIKIIDMFMSTCTIFVFLALMEYALVNVLLGDGPEGGSSPKKSKKESTNKSKGFLPMLLRDVKKRYKGKNSKLIQALNFPLSVSRIQSQVGEEEGTFHGQSLISTVSAASHSRSHQHFSPITTCLADPHCHLSAYSSHSGDNMYPTAESHVCHYAECQLDHHSHRVTNLCSEPHCYAHHPLEPCCQGNDSIHTICTSNFPSCSHAVTPHSCHNNCLCSSQQCLDRRNNICHCSSLCSPRGVSHRINLHSRCTSSHPYCSSQEATMSRGVSKGRIEPRQTLSSSFGSHSCERSVRRQSSPSERRSRSAERTFKRQSPAQSKRSISRSSERVSDTSKRKAIEWTDDDDDDDDDDEEKQGQMKDMRCHSSISISCDPTDPNPPHEEPSNAATFPKVPTPPPPPNKPAGLTEAQKRREKAIIVDRFSRIVFPSTFGLINAIYWIVFWIYL